MRVKPVGRQGNMPSPDDAPQNSGSAGPAWKNDRVFDGGGEIGALLRGIDWARHPLGPPATWPAALRTTLNLCLRNGLPASVRWGPDLLLLYNDAYVPILGDRHPDALGRSAREVWAEVWPVVGAQMEAGLQGKTVLKERSLVPMTRRGVKEDAWFTWSYTPIMDESGQSLGIFVTCSEDTAHVRRELELLDTRDRLATTLSAAEIGYWSLNAATQQVVADKNLAEIFLIPPEYAAGGAPLEVFLKSIHPDDREQTVAKIEAALEGGEHFEAEYRLKVRDNAERWVMARGRVVRDETGRATTMSGVLIDITKRRQSEWLINAHNKVLQLIASEASLESIFEELIGQVEAQGLDVIASVLLLDEHGRLRHGAAPSLPDDYNQAVDGIPIGPDVGTCGVAAYTGEVVLTPDLLADPNWALLKDRAERLGLLAAWSCPILSASGEILGTFGTFGTYFRQKRLPTARERKIVESLCKVAAIAIDRSRARDALARSEERFRMLADNISQFAWMGTGDGSLFWFNRRWLDYTGTTTEVVRGDRWQEVIHPDHRARVVEKYLRHVREGATWEDTFPLRGADGSFRWFLTRAFPIRDHAGAVERWFGTNTDITELREYQEELRQRDERFSQIADSLPQMVWGARPDGVVDYYNRRWYEYVGGVELPPQEFRWDLSLHPDDRAETVALWRQATQQGHIYQTEYRLRNTQGEYHWFLARALPIRDSEGKIVRWFGTCTDIDARKTLHEESIRIMERERAARLASETAGRMKDDFLATLSHELRTPLNPVLLLASEGAANETLPDAVRADFAAIAKNVALEARLIDDLLDLTRITRGKLALSFGPADVHAIIDDALANVANDLRTKKITVTKSYEASSTMVMADSVRLQQVFWNILRNAAKFTSAGGAISVTTRLTSDRKRIETVITDDGMGMTPKEVGRLFNAFVQGDHAGHSGSHRFGGLGLGLAISRMLVELHSGRISGRSDGVGRGSTFAVELPVSVSADAAAPGTSSGPSKNKPAIATVDGGRRRILFVEDHEPTRAALRTLLVRRRFEVIEAASVKEALELAAGLKFDLLMTDIGLPDGDGYEIVERLRDGRDFPAIALTGYGMEEDIARSRKAGFTTHLTKPVDIQDLDAVLAAISPDKTAD